MKSLIVLLTIIIAFNYSLFAVKDVTLDEKDMVDIEELLEENEIIFKTLKGLDYDEHGHIYFLAGHFVRILKVDRKTFKLVKVISSKGSGPGELYRPVSFEVKNDKIFVLDFSFGGIKVFDLEGNCLKEFRIRLSYLSLSLHLDDIIDVNSKDQIFFRQIDEESGTVITVYDMDGNKIKQIIPLEARMKDEMKKWTTKSIFEFFIDKNEDIVVLYKIEGTLQKFTPEGKLIWSTNLYNALPQELRVTKKFKVTKTNKSMATKYSMDFTDACELDNGRIFVSGVRIGLIYDRFGQPKCLVRQPEGGGLGTEIFWIDGKLFSKSKIYDLTKCGD